MKKPTTIFDEWKSYEREVVPVGAPDIQREECRRAFYAGAAAYAAAVYAATDADKNGSAERTLTALDKELQAIPNDLRVG